MSGILYAQDKDFKTAYSYFYEAFECLASNNDPRANSSFKYMILCKIMRNSKDEISQLVNSKHGLRYANTLDVSAIREVADAHFKESIVALREVMDKYPDQIEGDDVLKSHIKGLYDNLLEKNLFKIIETYTRVELSHIASKIKLDVRTVEHKLSEM
jgi:26S proteasome regulatory subunit N6